MNENEPTPSPTAIAYPVLVRSTTYHTVDHTDVHAEGDEYEITDPDLFETVIACGFAAYVGT